MSTPSVATVVPPAGESINTKWLILAAVAAGLILLYLCRDTTPSIIGMTVEQAKRRLKDTEYTIGEKVGFAEPLDGKDLGKIAEQQVDKEQKKINYKMYQIDVNNIDEYARLAKEKARQARQMAVMQAELERAMRATPPPPPIVEEPAPTEPPVVVPVAVAPVVQQKKKKVVDMGFGATGLSVRRKNKVVSEGFFW
jgi:hypothetical protein